MSCLNCKWYHLYHQDFCEGGYCENPKVKEYDIEKRCPFKEGE